jgi:hypothetical protein
MGECRRETKCRKKWNCNKNADRNRITVGLLSWRRWGIMRNAGTRHGNESQGTGHIWAGGNTLCSETEKLVDCIWNKEEGSDQWMGICYCISLQEDQF